MAYVLPFESVLLNFEEHIHKVELGGETVGVVGGVLWFITDE